MDLHQYFTRKLYWPVVQWNKGEFALSALSELSTSQWLNRSELMTQQWELVRKTVGKAIREVPYYKKACRLGGWDHQNKSFSYEDFLHFPKLEKETVRDRIKELLNPNYKGRITEGSTSGSTGQALLLYYSTEHESYSEAARWRAKSWWGITPGSRHVAFWGRFHSGYRDRLSQQAKSYLMNTILFSAFDVSESTNEKVWRKIDRFKPHIIYGYPSAIYFLARYLKKNNIAVKLIGLKAVMITAESISAEQRNLIEEVFKCHTANEYGCSETGGFVYECPHGSWHISSELTFIEFLDPNGNPVLPGEMGEIFLTHLRNDYMPLIRYRVGDLGRPLKGICACGRGLPLMDVSVAKESDRIWLKNGGVRMSGDFLYIQKAVMAEFPDALLHFRVTQTALDTFRVEAVAGQGSIENAERLFGRLMKKEFGQNIHVNFERVCEIKREPSGKLRYFISKLHTNQ